MKIIFVYNANSGFVSSLLDIGHKVISPDTYSCNLCKMTYGVVGEREEWKRYRESSKDEMEFLHQLRSTLDHSLVQLQIFQICI